MIAVVWLLLEKLHRSATESSTSIRRSCCGDDHPFMGAALSYTGGESEWTCIRPVVSIPTYEPSKGAATNFFICNLNTSEQDDTVKKCSGEACRHSAYPNCPSNTHGDDDEIVDPKETDKDLR